MSFSETIKTTARAEKVGVTKDELIVHLNDGRKIHVPLDWFPRLLHADLDELSRYELIGQGEGIHWPSIDEDISIEGLLDGRRSSESEHSFRQWLSKRN
jgi:hypothetical protein